MDRTITPWLVVGMHRPMYVDTVDTSDQGVATSITDAIEKLLVQYEVGGVGGKGAVACVPGPRRLPPVACRQWQP